MSFSTYAEFQNSPISEKILLAKVEAGKRLVGWTLHSGSIYKLTSFNYSVISSIEDSSVALTSVGSIGSVTAGKYFNDTTNGILYLRTSDSVNPNSKFISMTYVMFFSTSPVSLPWDLGSGFDVEWMPMIKSSSEFGSELDTKNQLGLAIEGSGTITFHNDQSFWIPLYDKVIFENKSVSVYSHSRGLPSTQVKLVYRGKIQTKSYNETQIQFGLKDAINELRSFPNLANMESVSGALIPDSLLLAKQRRFYGYVSGCRPTNIDQILEDGYLLTGTASQTDGSDIITGVGTSFLSHFSPDDEIILGSEDAISVKSVDSNTQITLSENVSIDLSGQTIRIKADKPKRYTNRIFKIAGHSLREPVATITSSDSPSVFSVDTVLDFEPGDSVIINSQIMTIRMVNGLTIKLTQNLSIPPSVSDTITRMSVSNVKLNGEPLVYIRDYTYDADNGTLTLDQLAEFNISKAKTLKGTLTFTDTNRSVTGTSTQFTKQLGPGMWIRATNQSSWFEVLSVETDTALTLRSASTYNATSSGLYKNPDYYTEGTSILVCDIIGKTIDGTKTGALLKTAPTISKDLLTEAGLSLLINSSSFTSAISLVPQRIGISIPASFSDTGVLSYKEILGKICNSTFSSIIQNEDFEIEFTVLRPRRSEAIVNKLDKTDILKMSVKSDSDRIIKTARVKYNRVESDPITGSESWSEVTAETKNAKHISKSTKEYVSETLLLTQADAQRLASRWAFYFDVAVSTVDIDTKLQTSRLSINDIVDIDYPKMYERIASTGNRKIAAIEYIKKNESSVSLSLVDFSNAFGRCSVIMPTGSNDYSTSTDDEKFYNGFITDSYGMQSNDPETYGTGLIW